MMIEGNGFAKKSSTEGLPQSKATTETPRLVAWIHKNIKGPIEDVQQ